VEVHDEKELEEAVEAGSTLIGVNNRNLNDFSVDLNTTFRLQRLMPSDTPVVSESGIAGREDIMKLREAGIAAALIGESLMRSNDQGKLLHEFMS
jgi:indole-3-glycerol phosphate synthase